MSAEIQKQQMQAVTIQDLYDNTDIAIKHDDLSFFLNQSPPAKWVKKHPYIKDHLYLPIEKVEFMLQRFFKLSRISILREGTAFNGVYVVVRVEYLHPVTNQMEWHDGIGAIQLQTSKGTSPADLANINNGAISMAFGIAKSVAIKDATDHIGRVFGRDLNRKDIMPNNQDEKLHNVQRQKEIDRLKKLINSAKSLEELEKLGVHVEKMEDESINELYTEKLKQYEKI